MRALLLLLANLPAVSHAVAQTGKLSNERQAEIERAISTFMAAAKVPGMSAAIVQNGEFVWSAGFGMADLENSVPATSQTLYRLGSISKPITATAAMQLWEHKKLDLDSPVQKYCPAFPRKPWPITTRELLGHLGGIRYYRVPEIPYSKSQSDPEVGNTRHFKNGIEAGLKFFADDPLVAPAPEHKEITVDPKLYDDYIGTYKMNEFSITIIREGDRLFAQLNGQKIQLFPESVRDYFFKIFDAQITFVTNGDRRATELILHEGGTDLHATRIE